MRHVSAFLLLSLALYGGLGVSFGQYNNRDSLLRVYKFAEEDTSKVFALKWLTWHYYFKASDSANHYLRRMINLSQNIGYTKGLFDAYNIKGILFYTNANYDSAITVFGQAFSLSNEDKFDKEKIYSLKYSGDSYSNSARFREADSCFLLLIDIASRSNDSASIAKGYKSIAQNYSAQGDYEGALKYFFKADTFMVNDISIDHGENFHNIANAYQTLENSKAAISYYEEALSIYKKIGNGYGENSILASLGKVELDNHNYLSAKDYLEKARAFFINYNDPAHLADMESNLGLAAYHLGNFDEALNYYEAALANIANIQGSRTLSNTYRGLGNLHATLKNFDKSIYFLKKALESAHKLGDVNTIMLSHEALAEAYYLNGDLDQAYKTAKQNQLLKDSVSALINDQMLHDLGEKYLNEKKEQEIKLLTAQNQLTEQEKRSQLYLLLGLIILVLLIAILFYILYRNRQKVATKLRELDSVKSNFFANISHEFRTPLTLIKGPVQDYLSKGSGPMENKELQLIDNNADRLLALVDQLLDLSKLESGSMQLAVEEAELGSFIKAIASSFSYVLTQKSIDFHMDIAPPENGIWFDKDILQKVVTNLLSNAIKYTPEAGEIRVSMLLSDKRAIISIENNGSELAPDELERIFDRFYQADHARDGAGIGLALVKELVELHKGLIMVTGKNGWINFKVSLPIRRSAFLTNELKAPTKDVPDPFPHIDLGVGATLNEVELSDDLPILLIVEDNSDVRALIRGIFEATYSIIEAENGLVGIERAIDHIPDIIISDVMMPEKDGVELAKTLKADERTSHIPIILLTAKAGEENELAGLETGADDYITKPFNNELLKVRVQKLVELRAKLRQRYSQEVILRPKDIAISSADEKFLERVQRLLDEKLADSKFNAGSFSADVGMSRMQLHRKLKALVGLTTTEFIRSQRLKMAAHLLEASDINVSEVGYEVGFNDPSYFAKCFREAYNCTPSEYARKSTIE